MRKTGAPGGYAAFLLDTLKKLSNSEFTWSFKVEHSPCDAPGITLSVASLTIVDERSAEILMGTI